MPVIIVILPALSTSILAICTPAATAAVMALVTSCCRNVEGARAMASAALPGEQVQRARQRSRSGAIDVAGQGFAQGVARATVLEEQRGCNGGIPRGHVNGG